LRCYICKKKRQPSEVFSPPVIAGYICRDHISPECVPSLLSKIEKKKAAKLKAEKVKIDRADRARTREQKEQLKSVNKLTAEAEFHVRRYVRARDKLTGVSCPSCDKSALEIEKKQGWKTGGAWDAGHYRSKGAARQHRFNVLQIWRQCKSCNAGDGKYRHKSETVSKKYRETLVARIGIELVEKIENDNTVRKFSKEYLRRVRDIFRKRANMYEKRLLRILKTN